MKLLCLLLAAFFVCQGSSLDYNGYQVLRISVETESQASQLAELEQSGQFDFWSHIILGKHVDVMASPANLLNLQQWLLVRNMDWHVMVADVETLIQLEKIPAGNSSTKVNSGHAMDWTSYHPIEEIYGWFDYLETTYDFCETEIIGQTYEGQNMIIMKVCKGGCGNKPAMWIDSGIHAREWIAPAVGTWMLNELVENDGAHPDLTEKLDWYFLPSHNPDGYHKSQTDDRMWRKTTTFYEGDSCQGTDANRNFDFHWGDTNGASGSSCSQTYFGPEAFSEVEARNVRDFVMAHKAEIKFYQTLHSYSQLVLMPWGYTSEPAPGYDAMLDLGNRGNDALYAVHGKTYEVGCIPCVLYVASGTSLDWALGVAEVPYVYSIELRDTGAYGFLLPPSEIIPNAEEAWAWHVVAAQQIIQEFSSSS